MRVVVYGAGAIGGVVAARLALAGTSVAVVARGAHAAAIDRRGLRLRWPAGDEVVALPVATTASSLSWTGEDVVVLAVKSQDTAGALDDLVAVAPDVPLVCCQNGVANEPAALRLFERVYGMCVMCPASHVEPGVVQAHSWPVSGMLDLGRFPAGSDETAEELAGLLRRATFESEVYADIMAWKYRKLVLNIGNAVSALFPPGPEAASVAAQAREEAERCLAVAGTAVTAEEAFTARRGDRIRRLEIGDGPAPQGSTWQSLARGTGAVETDFLNGEIVLLGRLHGVATPVNQELQRLTRAAARQGSAPGATALPEDLSRLSG